MYMFTNFNFNMIFNHFNENESHQSATVGEGSISIKTIIDFKYKY